jgi:flagellar motility protein MotE (MotC chaperone)
VFRFRIIPSTITVAMLLLCVKLMDLTHNTDALAQADAKPAEAATTTSKNKETAAKSDSVEAKKESSPEAGKAAERSEGKEDEKKPDDNPAVSSSPGVTVDRRYTPVEVELLQNLAQRRDGLDRWERNVVIKESTLSATEKRIDEKITQIESMKKEVAALLSQYNEKEDTKIRSLVKIYENMKPKDAARIFDEVEMPILLLVIDKMSEKKVAPILSAMDSRKAKSITVQLAEQRRINSKVTNSGIAQP